MFIPFEWGKHTCSFYVFPKDVADKIKKKSKWDATSYKLVMQCTFLFENLYMSLRQWKEFKNGNTEKSGRFYGFFFKNNHHCCGKLPRSKININKRQEFFL